jgi:transposase
MRTLRNDQWQKIRDFLDACPDVYLGTEADSRRFIEAVLWISRTGAPWRDLPPRYGNWNSIYKRYARWCGCGNITTDRMKAVANPGGTHGMQKVWEHHHCEKRTHRNPLVRCRDVGEDARPFR